MLICVILNMKARKTYHLNEIKAMPKKPVLLIPAFREEIIVDLGTRGRQRATAFLVRINRGQVAFVTSNRELKVLNDSNPLTSATKRVRCLISRQELNKIKALIKERNKTESRIRRACERLHEAWEG